jgi:acyl-CoA synthetase (AMP-forming)/AMP-acid ligase II
MVLLVMSTDTSGSRVVSMVSFSNDFHSGEHDLDRNTDVINVSGHRLSTAEIESALITHKGVAETAVIGITDDLTGQTVVAFVTLKPYASSPRFYGVVN